MPALALAALAVLTAAAPAPASAAAPIPPAPARWVTDPAGFLSPGARAALDARLEGYERATGHQVVVWIGDSLEGAPLADWAVRTFEAWRVGRRGLDDGIAIFVLAADRAIDIEVGYGLEGQVPDATASRIIREVMAPRLRAGDRDGAITAGADAILAAIEGEPWTGAPAPAPPTGGGGPSTGTWIGGGIVLLVLLVLGILHPRAALFLLWTIASRGHGGGGGFGGLGGGFAGGGGRSGGGGARGGW